MQIEFGQASDPGLDPTKRVNEDACGYAETKLGHLFVVCDGMGGHAGGKQASDIAIRTIFDIVGNAPDGSSRHDKLAQGIEQAARKVYRIGGPASNQARPGSTCVAAMFAEGKAEIAHVGDSRAYAVRGSQIFRLTRDHSMVQEMIDNGVITEKEAHGHPDSNKITRALGMTPEVEVELRDEALELFDGDVIILATDGLSDLVRNNDILLTVTEYMEKTGVQGVCTELVALANRRGGHDNITVQAIRVLKTGPKASPTRVQEPEIATAGSPIATTIEGAPARSATVIQEPAPLGTADGHLGTADGRLGPSGQPIPEPTTMDAPTPLSQTEPGRPAPTLVDHTLRDSGQRPLARHHHDMGPLSSERDPQQRNLLYLVFVMAAIIGLLVALLIWALGFRDA